MGLLSTCFSQSLPEIRNRSSRFIRLEGVTPSSIIRCMETRSLQHSYECNVNFSDTGSLSHFCLIPRVLNEIQQDQVHTVTLIRLCWQTKLWYPQLLQMLIRRPILIPSLTSLLVDPKENLHPLVLNKTLILVAWQQ